MFCLAANYNAPHNNTPMLGVHGREAESPLFGGTIRVKDTDMPYFVFDLINPQASFL